MVNHDASGTKGASWVQIIAYTPFGMSRYDIHCTWEQYVEGRKAYEEGALMQDAFPFLSVDDREFLISGLTPLEWKRMFSDSE